MSKKFLIWFTVLTLGLTSAISIGGVVNAERTSADFSDLKDLDATTKAKFDAMIAAGIFEGISDGYFGIEEEMNRAQFAKVAALIFGLKVDPTVKTSSFLDVDSDDSANGWALPYIEAVKAAGITDGYGHGTFNPGGQVTNEQLATFLIRGLGKESQALSAPGVDDDTVSGWAQGYVQLALELKLLGNSPDGTFNGKAGASRELLATSSFEGAKGFEAVQPLEVSGADFVSGNKLELRLTAMIDLNSIDLSKITVNGVPLDPKLDSYVLSDDKKTIIIKLHEGFVLDTSKTPVIVVDGLKTLFGNKVKNEGSKPIPVKVTEPPVVPQQSSYSPWIPTPVPSNNVKLTIDVESGIITQTTASYRVVGSVTGSVYYSVRSAVYEAPSLDDIKLGTNAIVYGSKELQGTTAYLYLEGLAADTSYVLYAYALANDKTSVISSVRFQTLAQEQDIPNTTFHTEGIPIRLRSHQMTTDSF